MMATEKIKIGKITGKFAPSTINYYHNVLPDGTTYGGQLDLATLRKMRNDYQISASLNIITFAARRFEWGIEPNGATPEATRFIERQITLLFNSLIKIFGKALWAGYSPATKVFELEDKTNFIHISKLRDLAPESCEVKEDDYGNFDGIKQGGYTGQQEIPVKYSFWYANFMEDGNLYGRSLLTPAFKPWYYGELIHLFANRYYERFGEPVTVGRAPSTDTVQLVEDNSTQSSQDAVASMHQMVEQLKNNSSVTLPSDRDANGNYWFDVDYLESQMRGVDFDKYLSRLDSEKARSVLIPELLLGAGRVGSFELGKEHKKTFYDNLMGMFDEFVEYINLHLVRQVIDLNYGGKMDYPRFYYVPSAVIDDAVLGSVLNTLINTKSSDKIPNMEDLAKKLGVTTEEAQIIADETEVDTPPDVRQRQMSRISNYVKKVMSSNISEYDKKMALAGIKIGFKEEYKDKENLYESRQKQIQDTAVRLYSYGTRKILDNISKIMGVEYADN